MVILADGNYFKIKLCRSYIFFLKQFNGTGVAGVEGGVITSKHGNIIRAGITCTKILL